jgi:hypothetical protein
MAKKAEVLNQVVIHIILVTLIFALFFMASAGKINARDVKQQVNEKQIALLIDSAVSGMSFEIKKNNENGIISKIEIKEGRVFVVVSGFASRQGYPYFSKYSVTVKEETDRFIIFVR